MNVARTHDAGAPAPPKWTVIENLHSRIPSSKKSGYWLGIEGMLNDTIIAEFNKLGLGDLLH